MVTGEELLELLPPAEPPAGFETRVLERLGLPVPAPADTYPAGTYPQLLSRREKTARRHGPGRGARLGADQPTAPPAGPGGTSRPGRLRRLLATTAIGLAVIAAGLGGWRIGVGTAPGPAPEPLSSATLMSATDQDVGDIFLYSGSFRWVYMRVDMPSGDELVTCQVVGADGRVTTIGSFNLRGGHGAWGNADQRSLGAMRGAQLVSPDGTVLATATFAN
jgi:hypothetical protein